MTSSPLIFRLLLALYLSQSLFSAGGLLAVPVAAAGPGGDRTEPLFGVPALTVDGQHDGYELGRYLEILEDPDRRFSIEEIAGPEFHDAFTPSARSVPNFGYTNSAYWVRLRLARAEHTERDWLLECALPAMDSMTLFQRAPDGGWSRREVGDVFPFALRELRHRNGVLRIRLGERPYRPEVFYLRFATQGIVQMSLQLWSPRAFAEKVYEEQYGLGLYYGILLAMIVFNLFLFFAVGDRSYLYYVLYILCFALTLLSVNGLAFQFFWPNSPGWANLCVNFFLGFTGVSMVMFSRNFLQTWDHAPLLDRWLLFLAGLCWVYTLFVLFVPYRLGVRIGVGMTPVVCISVFYAGARVWLYGFGPARYFLLAWAGLILGIFAFVLKNVGLLPAIFLTEYGLQIGSAVEVLLLSLALGDRINVLRREKNEAARALNETLEEQVGIRTRELHTALQYLHDANEELKEKDAYIQNELELAAKIQRGILPEDTVSYNGIRVLTHYDSFEKVGGDFLAIEPLDGDRLGIFIADVSGHGLPAALLTTMTRLSFSEALRRYSSPAKILTDINDSIRRTVKTEEFLTAFCVVIDADYRLKYSSAGHHHGFLLRHGRGTADRMETPGVVLGLIDELTVPFEDKQDELLRGDRMFLFTDGMVEATDQNLEVYGRKRLYESLIESLDRPLEEQKEWVLRRWREFIRGTPVQDDVSFILLEFDGIIDD